MCIPYIYEQTYLPSKQARSSVFLDESPWRGTLTSTILCDLAIFKSNPTTLTLNQTLSSLIQLVLLSHYSHSHLSTNKSTKMQKQRKQKEPSIGIDLVPLIPVSVHGKIIQSKSYQMIWEKEQHHLMYPSLIQKDWLKLLQRIKLHEMLKIQSLMQRD